MITYPFTMPAFAPDAVANRLYWTETLADGVTVLPENFTDFTTSASPGNLTVNELSKIDYQTDQVDAAGNRSLRSSVGTIASATDTTPPAAPANITPGPGDTAAPTNAVFTRGKRTK